MKHRASFLFSVKSVINKFHSCLTDSFSLSHSLRYDRQTYQFNFHQIRIEFRQSWQILMRFNYGKGIIWVKMSICFENKTMAKPMNFQRKIVSLNVKFLITTIQSIPGQREHVNPKFWSPNLFQIQKWYSNPF